MERIFGRAWIYVGHDSQLREVGDFVTARFGRDRIIVARHDDGAVHAFYNRCAHRGAEVCPGSSGNARSFTCPYHAWTYRTDGSLESVPLAAGYADGLEPRKRELGLEPVARIARYRGFLFANRSRNGVGLEEFLGPDVRAAFDNLVDRAPDGEVVQTGGRTVQRYRANWKLQIENSIDLLHPSILHRNAVDCADRLPDEAINEASDIEVALTRSNGLSPTQWDEMRTAALPRGHCWMGGFIGDVAKEENTAAAVGWQRDYRAALARRHGEAKAEAVLDFSRHNTIVYPNLFVNPQLGQIRILSRSRSTAPNSTATCSSSAGRRRSCTAPPYGPSISSTRRPRSSPPTITRCSSAFSKPWPMATAPGSTGRGGSTEAASRKPRSPATAPTKSSCATSTTPG